MEITANPQLHGDNVSILKSKKPELQTVIVEGYLLDKTVDELKGKGYEIVDIVCVNAKDDVWEIVYYNPE